MKIDNFFAELKRRNVIRFAGLYLVGAWLLVQVAGTVLPMFGAPEWLPRSIVILLAIGFIPALVFSWVFEMTPQGLKRDEDVRPEESIAPQTGRRMNRMIIAVLVLALGYFAIDKFVLTPRRAALPNDSLSGASAKSIAVLPLINTSGDPGNDYFSDGLSEELIAVLAKIPGLKIIGRSSSFLFKGKSDDRRTIGQKLGVANLLEGSVRKQGERVRIVAELINAADGRALWSETYDRELKDVFAVQSEIASAVAEQMKVKLLGLTARSDAVPSNQNLAAHNAVLQSDFYFQQQTAESLRKAIGFLQDAVRLDPNYAFAFAKLSQAWRQYGASFATADADKAYTESRMAAEKAAQLAPDLVEAHKALGWVAMTPNLNFQEAEKEFRRALEGSPGDAAAKNALSYALMAQGRLAESEQVGREALSLDPLLTGIWYNLGRLTVAAGRYKEAEDALRKGLELQPHASRFNTYLATLDLLQNNPKLALQHAQAESDDFWREYALTLTQQADGDRATANTALKSFSDKYAANGAYQIAILYAVRKEPDEVFRWLDKAYATHDSGLTQLVITPFLQEYRDDPRFKALCQKLAVQIPAASPIHE